MERKPDTGGDFDGVAPVYDALAFLVFGQRLRQAQAVFLATIPGDASVLMVGGGTGWLLEQALTRCQPRRVVYLEASAQMLARASKRVVRKNIVGSVEFRVGNETSLNADEPFDVIITPFVMDVFSEETLRTQFIPMVHSKLKTNGLWFVTDFVTPRRSWQKLLLWAMIRFFRFTTGMQARHLADWQTVLTQAGLVCKQQRSQVGGMVMAEVWTHNVRS